MPRYKSFTTGDYGESLRALEHAVNDWLRQESPRILFVSQSAHHHHLVVSFVYERSERQPRAAVATESAEVPEVFERTLGGSDLDPTEQPDVLLPEAELPY